MEKIDKSKWGDGPWMSEPDYEKWTDAATGLECLIRRSVTGALCGYVKIPEDNPLHNVAYQNKPLSQILVHGGLTFAGDIENDGQYWVGFDCAHYTDICPAIFIMPGFNRGEYKDIEFVRQQCRLLADQVSVFATTWTEQ
ncbi:hypothetical protein [Oxalobacter formigenes]